MAWAFLSGIEANHTGTGRFMQHLQGAILQRGKFDGTIVYSPAGQRLTADGQALLASVPHLVLFHPQMLGLADTLALVQRRAAAGLRTHLYLLDNFFFCLRSYNHLDDAVEPCFRCIGPGQSRNAAVSGCTPWPANDPGAAAFIDALGALVRAGALALFAQNRGQIDLARRHFGPGADITYVGLWCADWTTYVDAFQKAGRAEGDAVEGPPAFDVVYHGSRDLAKGIGWVLAVAARTPDVRYLVPIDRGAANVGAPANVTIAPMRWESGLYDAVRGARLVLAPSLWSSPCEGALIKNIVIAKAPAVVDIASAFSAEIPADVVLKLPAAPDAGAAAIRTALGAGWRPDVRARTDWVAAFRGFNEAVTARLLPAGGS